MKIGVRIVINMVVPVNLEDYFEWLADNAESIGAKPDELRDTKFVYDYLTDIVDLAKVVYDQTRTESPDMPDIELEVTDIPDEDDGEGYPWYKEWTETGGFNPDEDYEPGWYFTMASETYGAEDFGPYDTEAAALVGLGSVKIEAELLDDGVERMWTGPFYRE